MYFSIVYNNDIVKQTSEMKGMLMATEKKFDIYQTVTDRIIEQLKQGYIPWQKPWGGIASGAFNRVSKKPYSFINQMLLQHDGEYATYKQWAKLGGKIKSGAESEIVVFWKIMPITETDKNGEEVTKKIPFLRYYRVFHISQVEGVEPLDASIAIEHEPIEIAEKVKNDYAEREGIEIREVAGDKAFYSVACDHIVMPLMEQFKDINEYYSTLFHECSHSTGAKHRLGRFNIDAKIAAFGSPEYSKEELVAEMSSAFLMNHCGIETDNTFNNSAAYIQSWIAALSNDKKMIVSASSRAEKAANYILYGKEGKAA